jgi:DNA-binding protein Fis
MLIEATLEYAGNDKTRASKLLGIGRKTLYRKLDEYSEKSEADGSIQRLKIDVID